jgi:hypothetical protein
MPDRKLIVMDNKEYWEHRINKENHQGPRVKQDQKINYY